MILYYKKSYKTKNAQLIPPLEVFDSLENDDYNFIKKIYKRELIENKSKEQLYTQAELEYIRNTKSVNICVHPNQYPFVIFGKDTYSGISIDYLEEISKKTNLTFKIIPSINHYQHIKMLKDGQCDIVPLLLTKPNMFDFLTTTISTIEDDIVLVTRIKEAYSNDLDTLVDKKIAIQKGTPSLNKYVKSIYPNMNLIEVEGINVDKVASGEFYGQIGASYQMAYEIATKYFTNRSSWRKWLENNFESKDELWLEYPLKKSGKERILYY